LAETHDKCVMLSCLFGSQGLTAILLLFGAASKLVPTVGRNRLIEIDN